MSSSEHSSNTFRTDTESLFYDVQNATLEMDAGETFTDTSSSSPAAAELQETFWSQHGRKIKVTLGALAVVGTMAFSASKLPGSIEKVEQAAKWAVPTIIATETLGYLGLAGMTVATGGKIGNPLTLQSRLKEVRREVLGSGSFRAAQVANTVGSLGTSATVVGVTVSSLPVETWPVMFTGAAAGAAPAATRWFLFRDKGDSENRRSHIGQRVYRSIGRWMTEHTATNRETPA